MRKFFCCLFAAAFMLCSASCGSKPVSKEGVETSVETVRKISDEELKAEMIGNWETTKEFLNEMEKDKEDIEYKRYVFSEDGSGFYYISDDKKQLVHWELTPDGGMNILYDDMGELIEHYDYIGYNMVNKKDTPDGKLEIRISRVKDFTKPLSE